MNETQTTQITQYNKLIVNYDTYEFTPSNYSQIVIDNPWYLDISSAPDFINTFNTNIYEINNIPMSIKEDLYSINDYKYYRGLYMYSTEDSIITFTNENVDHTTMITNFLQTMDVTNNINILDYFVYYNYTRTGWCSGYPSDYSPTQQQSILCPITQARSNAYFGGQLFPIIRTITITINSNNLQMHVPTHTVTYSGNYGSGEYEVAEGDYTYYDYCDILLNKACNVNASYMNQFQYIYKYDYMRLGRTVNNLTFDYSGDTINNLFGLLHAMQPGVGHQILTCPNNRSMTLPSGSQNVADIINMVNTSSHGFSLTSDNHYIYINYPQPFIINPVCNIIDENTDVTETFATKKILCTHPQFKQINCTVTYNGNQYICNERLTPAEFLRWIYDKTGVKCKIHNNTITCLDNNLHVTDNQYFKFKEFGIVENLCNMQTIDYKVNIANTLKLIDIDYNPILETYNYNVNITDNIMSALNNKVKFL